MSESYPVFCSTLGIHLYPWQADAFGTAFRREQGRFVHRLAGISVPRGNGKTFGDATGGMWRFRFGPPGTTILSVGLLTEGAKLILDAARTLFRTYPVLSDGVEELAEGFRLAATGSRWIIRSREHESSRGLHPDLTLYDEIGWAADDELFASLLSAQASVADPLMLITSTVGRRKSGPLWSVKEMGERGEPETFWYHSSENGSPRVTAAFLERQRRLLLPQQFSREHQNQWIDAADSFTDQTSVDAAMAQPIEPSPGRPRVMAVDIGSVHDPSVVGVGHRREDGAIVVDHLRTLQGSKEAPVSMAALEQVIMDLSKAYAPVKTIRIESWQGIASAQRLTALGLPVELFTPTAKVHSEEWPVLAQHLATRSLHLPQHPQLREELLGLSYEVTALGVRVTDRTRVHQDHAVVVRMLVASLAQPAPPPLQIFACVPPPMIAPDGREYSPAVSRFLRGE